MSDSPQNDEGRKERTLLGRRCVTVHHGTLYIDTRIATILRLTENQDLPEPRYDPDDETSPGSDRKGTIVLTPIVRVRPSRKGLLYGTAIVTILVLLFTFEARRLWSRQELDEATASLPPVPRASVSETVSSPALATEVRRGPSGRPTEIRGPDANRVLVAFCKSSDPGGGRKPVGLSPIAGQGPGVVYGHFEDVTAPGETLAILIYLDPRISRWRAGSGQEPIKPFRATRASASDS